MLKQGSKFGRLLLIKILQLFISVKILIPENYKNAPHQTTFNFLTREDDGYES